MGELIRIILIVILSITINSLSYYYLLDKHKNDKKIKDDYTLIKSLNMYAISLIVFVLFVGLAYYINIFALELTNITLMVLLVIASYLLAIIISFVHSNMTVEFVKYLLRNKERDKRIVTLIIHNILILGLSYASLYSFVPLVDFWITKALRIIMLVSFMLSFTVVIIYKDAKEYLPLKKINRN